MGGPEEHATGVTRASLDPQRAIPVETPWGKFALHLVDDEVVCVQAFCPHMEGPLFEGTRSGTKLICPWHGWVFGLSSCERVGAGEGERACLTRLSVVDRGEEGLALQPVDAPED